MSFLHPLGLLLLLSLPIIVLLHLFRQERRRQEVSSIYLWREISNQHSRRMRPRLLRNANLVLQLLAALLASLAIAQPRFETQALSGADEMIVLFDDSASMQADSGGVSRIDLARNRAREVIGRSTRNTRVMLVSAGPHPSVVQPFTLDRTLLYDAIRSWQPTDGANDLAGALRLVRSLGTDERTDIVFVTDGAVVLPAGSALPANLRVAPVVAPDDRTANRAITSFELRARPNGSAFEVLASVANHANDSATVNLELSADSEVISTRTVELEPDEERLVTAVIPRSSGTIYRARLLGNDDALAVDDQAFSAARGERPVRIQLVTAGNLFLESFLAVYPNVDLTVTDTVSQSTGYDILILDQVPAPARVRGNVIAIGTALPDGPFTPQGTETIDAPISARGDHPILSDLRLDQIRVASIVTGELNPRATVLASSGPYPLLYVYRADNLTLVGTTFSLSSTDLALRGSFPILMHNMIDWLAPVAPGGDVGYANVGSTVQLYVPPGEEVVVIRPDGSPIRSTPQTTPWSFTDTRESGIYTVRGESFTSHFAVSLASATESDLRNRLSALARTSEEPTVEGTTGRGVWQWIALAALLLLVVDWIVWARRH